jgi:hypothetical protein
MMKPASMVDLLKGEPAELALLTTYNFEPSFFEECLLRTRSLGEARRIVVFVDASEWARSDTTRVRGLNCRWCLSSEARDFARSELGDTDLWQREPQPRWLYA